MNNKGKKQNYVVYVEYENGYFSENHCILKYADLQTAKSIKRHFDKILWWNDYTQTGYFVNFVSRKYCVNFRDFETETFSDETQTEYLLLLQNAFDMKTGEIVK